MNHILKVFLLGSIICGIFSCNISSTTYADKKERPLSTVYTQMLLKNQFTIQYLIKTNYMGTDIVDGYIQEIENIQNKVNTQITLVKNKENEFLERKFILNEKAEELSECILNKNGETFMFNKLNTKKGNKYFTLDYEKGISKVTGSAPNTFSLEFKQLRFYLNEIMPADLKLPYYPGIELYYKGFGDENIDGKTLQYEEFGNHFFTKRYYFDSGKLIAMIQIMKPQVETISENSYFFHRLNPKETNRVLKSSGSVLIEFKDFKEAIDEELFEIPSKTKIKEILFK